MPKMQWVVERDDETEETLTVEYEFYPATRATESCPEADAEVEIVAVTDADGADVPLDGHTLGRIEEAALEHAIEQAACDRARAEDEAFEAHRERVREAIYGRE